MTQVATYSNPIRLLICAPDLLTRVGLAALLQEYEELAVVGQVMPTAELPEQALLYQAEVIVWDLGWVTPDLVALLAQIADDAPPILVLLPTSDDGLSLRQAGARALLLRDSEPAALVATISTLMHGLVVFDPAILPPLPVSSSSAIDSLVEPLTKREDEVLQALALGLSNKLIARRLDISEHTVKFHVNAILGKLGAQSRTDAVVRATRAGLIQL